MSNQFFVTNVQKITLQMFKFTKILTLCLKNFWPWQEHKEYIGNYWTLKDEIATVIVIVNLVGQLLGGFLVLLRFLVTPSVILLTAIVILQTIAYSIIFDVKFLMRHLAMIGALFLLLAEHKDRKHRQAKTASPGLPVLEDKRPSSGLQFFGRIFLVLLFCTLLHFWGFAQDSEAAKVDLADPILELIGVKTEIVNDAFGLFFIFLIAVGWRTRFCSVILIIWLGVLNFFVNDFWNHLSDSMMYDYKRYDFFQTLTVIGGLKLLLALGPGHLSLDYEKKGM